MKEEECKGSHLIDLKTGKCTNCPYQAGSSQEDYQNATKHLNL